MLIGAVDGVVIGPIVAWVGVDTLCTFEGLVVVVVFGSVIAEVAVVGAMEPAVFS